MGQISEKTKRARTKRLLNSQYLLTIPNALHKEIKTLAANNQETMNLFIIKILTSEMKKKVKFWNKKN